MPFHSPLINHISSVIMVLSTIFVINYLFNGSCMHTDKELGQGIRDGEKEAI